MGRCCPLAKRGYSRDGKKGTLQIVYGLLCAPDGCPVAIEVFEGNTGDPTTLAPQIDKLKQRFGLSHVVLVGDRGMITEARITEDIKSAGLDWITALRGPAIKDLLNSGVLQLTLFDQRDMASITSPDFPGERLVVCRNADLAAERSRKREDLLATTEKDLGRIKTAVERKRNPLHGTAAIALAVGEVLNTYKMKKHFDLTITADAFSFARKTAEIATEAATDGLYVVRINLPVFKGRAQEADDRRDAGWAAGAQLPHAAGRSGDDGAQYHRHRDQPALSADRDDAADTSAAEGVRPAGACSVASSGWQKQHFLQYHQRFM